MRQTNCDVVRHEIKFYVRPLGPLWRNQASQPLQLLLNLLSTRHYFTQSTNYPHKSHVRTPPGIIITLLYYKTHCLSISSKLLFDTPHRRGIKGCIPSTTIAGAGLHSFNNCLRCTSYRGCRPAHQIPVQCWASVAAHCWFNASQSFTTLAQH